MDSPIANAVTGFVIAEGYWCDDKLGLNKVNKSLKKPKNSMTDTSGAGKEFGCAWGEANRKVILLESEKECGGCVKIAHAFNYGLDHAPNYERFYINANLFHRNITKVSNFSFNGTINGDFIFPYTCTSLAGMNLLINSMTQSEVFKKTRISLVKQGECWPILHNELVYFKEIELNPKVRSIFFTEYGMEYFVLKQMISVRRNSN